MYFFKMEEKIFKSKPANPFNVLVAEFREDLKDRGIVAEEMVVRTMADKKWRQMLKDEKSRILCGPEETRMTKF